MWALLLYVFFAIAFLRLRAVCSAGFRGFFSLIRRNEAGMSYGM
jgi:hypothetical protein